MRGCWRWAFVNRHYGGADVPENLQLEKIQNLRARFVIEFENCYLKRCENCCLKNIAKKRRSEERRVGKECQ